MHEESSATESPWRADYMSSWYGRPRVPRGDMSAIILHVLKDKSMHGYEIMSTLEARSHGIWRPSPGSVYPTLQLLEEQELVSSADAHGKKVFTLTEKGLAKLGKNGSTQPWEQKHLSGMRFREIMSAVHDIMKTLKVVVFQGSEEDNAEAKALLEELHTKLTSISQKYSKE